MRRPLTLILVFILAVLAAGAITLSFQYDMAVRDQMIEYRGKGWKKSPENQFYSAVRKYGDWPPLMIMGAVGLLIAWRMKNRTWVRIVVAAMIASTLAGILANASRLTTGRARPRESIEQKFYGLWYQEEKTAKNRLTIGQPAYNSFPSGHTATAFGFAGVIFFASPVLGVGALMIAGLIAWASIVIGAHHFSDVTVSIILAMVVAWFTWQWSLKHGDRTWYEIRRRFRQMTTKSKL